MISLHQTRQSLQLLSAESAPELHNESSCDMDAGFRQRDCDFLYLTGRIRRVQITSAPDNIVIILLVVSDLRMLPDGVDVSFLAEPGPRCIKPFCQENSISRIEQRGSSAA